MGFALKHITLWHGIKCIFVLLVACMCASAAAQNKSNKGKEFWLGYGHNILFTAEAPGNTQNQVVYLSAEQAATVTVSIPANGWSQTVNIPANTVDAGIIIPKTGANDARLLSEGLFNRGIHIESSVPIVAYAHQYGLVSSAATMLMPVETFGYTYYSLNFTQLSNYSDCYSWFYVVAAEDNTKLEITPADTTEGGWLKHQTYTIQLNKGQIYNVFGKKTGSYTGKDMTGSKIVSVTGADGNCHPVAVFSGSSRNVVCDGNGGEVMQQQIFPAVAWGTKYVTFHNTNSINNPIFTPFLNHYRVLVSDANTIVKRNGVVLSGLINNCYYQFSSSSGDYIEADKPILVAQYTGNSNECTASTATNAVGDPEMIYLSPIEQGVKTAIFYTTRNQAIDYNFVTAIIPSAAVNTLKLDGVQIGAADFITHPNNSNYSVVVKRITGPAAQHSLIADSSFIATVYGSGNYESYGYNVGTRVNNLNAYSEIKNTLNTTGITDSFTCPKTPFRLNIKLAYKATKLEWNLSAATAGLSPAVDSIILQPVPVDSSMINGRLYYTYTLQQNFKANSVGNFTIPVLYTAPDIDACNQTEQVNIFFNVKDGPIANFSAVGYTCLNDSITLIGAVNGAGYTIQSYRWEFMDNSIASGTTTTKAFQTVGNQSIRFQAFATNGCIADTTKSVAIHPLPAARFNAPSFSCVGDTVLFSDSSTIQTGSISTRQWTFGDGINLTTNSNQNISHGFLQPGNYQVGLQVISNDGCKSDTTFKPITVAAKPTAFFTITGKPCLGDSIIITNQSFYNSGNIVALRWDFGNGQTAVNNSSQPFGLTYSNTGNYSIALKAEADNGCVSSAYLKNLTIYPLPVVDAGTDKIIQAGNTVLLNASLNNVNEYDIVWTPSAFLSNSATLQPVASPVVSIKYQLMATHKSSGCSNKDSILVTVIKQLQIPNAFSPNGDGINDVWKIPGIEAYPKAIVSIFSRSGEKIFESAQYADHPWNGKRNDKDAPMGSYFYIITFNNTAQERKAGTVLLLR